MIFRDRTDAGRLLADKLQRFAQAPGVLVLALPRGGVPVAYEIARAIKVPMDVFIVRKLGVPDQPELAMGAIASGGTRVLNESLIRALGVSRGLVDRITEQEQTEVQRRERLYRGDRPFPDLHGRTVILVDDGLATGASMYAAVKALRQLTPARLIVAVPVAVEEVCTQLRPIVDEIICATTPQPFEGVGRWYQNFAQTTDDEVRELLRRANLGTASTSA